MLEETPPHSISETTERTLAGLNKLGTQTFALSPFSQYFDDWLVNLRPVLAEFEATVGDDAAFIQERDQILVEIEGELAKKRL